VSGLHHVGSRGARIGFHASSQTAREMRFKDLSLLYTVI
jgi:hypothetical protein